MNLKRIYDVDIPVIGLTGGIATGKSTASSLFRKEGAAVICADQLVKRVYQQQETIDFVRSFSPNCVENNRINFPKLRQTFFEKESEDLASFIYQRLPALFCQQLDHLRPQPFVIYDVPLLFEKNLQNLCDATLLIYCPEELQRKRLRERDHIDDALIDKMLLAQLPIEKKRLLADTVIENMGPLSQLESRVQDYLINKIRVKFT